MASISDTRGTQMRTYNRANSVVFRKTNEQFGGLSNMAGGFPLRVNGIRILTSEALYQACRFPHRPEVQRLIMGQTSPMTAKMKSKPYRQDSRLDWDYVRVKIMRWCLRVKLAQNWDAFSKLLLETRGRHIVEESRKDVFWGAKPLDEATLVGMNVLGRLLMELREAVKAEGRGAFLRVEPIGIPDFLLGGRPIEIITAQGGEMAAPIAKSIAHPSRDDVSRATAVQASLFELPAVKEASSPEYASESAKSAGIADLKPYPKMKDFSVPWLGEVPEHWDIRPLKRWVRMNTEVLPETTAPDHEFRYIDIGSVGTGFLTQKPQRFRFIDAPSRARRVVHKDDTIVSTVRTYLKAIYFFEEEAGELVCSTGFAVLTPRVGTLPKFVSYLVQSNPFTDRVTADSIGIAYPAIAEARLGSFHVAVPPFSEQAAIVRFLDHYDRKIRRYIRANQKLTKLLEEQRQAVIHRAVTRGLDPNVRLKFSGVEWLGDVPEHWGVVRSKYIFREVDYRSATGAEPHLSMSQKFGLIPSSQIEEKRLVSESYAGAKLCEKGDLVLNRLKAHLGVFALAPERGIVSPDYTVFRPIRELEARYFESVFRTPACRVELRQRAKGIVQGFWRLYTDDFYDIRMPAPPVDEQKRIIAQLDIDLAGLDTAVKRFEREIALLREYRTRLIADVVTGKLDVRGVELPSLDEAEVPDYLEIGEDTEADEMTDTDEITNGDEQ